MEVIRASVDRFENDYAVVYSDQDNRRFNVPLRLMGEIKPGVRVLLTLEDNSVSSVREDKKATDNARERIRRKYQRLKEGHHL